MVLGTKHLFPSFSCKSTRLRTRSSEVTELLQDLNHSPLQVIVIAIIEFKHQVMVEVNEIIHEHDDGDDEVMALQEGNQKAHQKAFRRVELVH